MAGQGILVGTNPLWQGCQAVLSATYRGHVRVGRCHLYQVDVVGSILPGRVVVIDVQEGDIHLWATRGAVVSEGQQEQGQGQDPQGFWFQQKPVSRRA